MNRATKLDELRSLISRRIEFAAIESSCGGDHPLTPGTQDEITKLLSSSERDAMSLIASLSADERYWVAEVFGDISARLQSERFIDFLINQSRADIDNDYYYDIVYAKQAIKKKT